MLKKLKTTFNAGLSKEEYQRIKPRVAQQNMKTLQGFSILTAILMFLLTGVTFFNLFLSLTANRAAYLIMGIVSVVVFLVDWKILPKYPHFARAWFYFFLFAVIVFSIYIGVFTNVSQRASTICVLLLAIPLMITDKPWRISILLSISVLLFCVTSYQLKNHTLFLADFVNCLCMFIIGIAINFTYQNMKYRSINDEYIIDQNNIQLINAQKMQLEESRISIILSQIQPHFLYNALLVIQELCVINPKEAEQATIEFSRFLRGNLDSLNTDSPITFEKELQHTKYYLALEQKRFGKKLNIEWNIHNTAFRIPALTLQPIVENAVRYGVTKKKGGGTVTISSEETEQENRIIVQDDGMGFDVNQSKEDGKTHVGISNVKKRLEDICGGTLTIKSSEGIGTTVTIIIPKQTESPDLKS